MKFKAGDRVSWSSQAMGSTTKKQGKLIGVVPARVGLFVQFPFLKKLPPSRIKGTSGFIFQDRYLVEVDRGEGKVTWFYAPLCSVVDRCMEQEGK